MLIKFIDDIFHTMNVSQTFLLYNKYQDKYMKIKDKLEKKDYPICILNNIEDYDELRHRIFIMNVDLFEKIFDKNKITVVLCLDEVTSNKINNIITDIKDKGIAVEKLYVFDSQ